MGRRKAKHGSWLKNGVNYKFDAAENAQDVRLIDFENLDANDWWVTNQFPDQQGASAARTSRSGLGAV